MPHAGYETSFNNALEALKLIKDLHSVAGRSGATLTETAIKFQYFGGPCSLSVPGYTFEPEGLGLGEKILILHYLTSDGVIEENPQSTTFQSLPGGMFYFSTFRKRGPNRVVKDFGENIRGLLEIAEKSGWRKEPLGDVSFAIPALPNIDVTVVAHHGDDEFPPEVQFLFRRDITSFLPLEDVAVLAGIVATRLTIAKQGLSS